MKTCSFVTLSILFGCLGLTSCVAPLIIGGGATVGAMATRDKGLGGTMSDSGLSTKIKSSLYEFHPDLYSQITVNIQNGEVLLTGLVKTKEWRTKAQELVWKVQGVKQVYNYIEVNSKQSAWSTVLKDGYITTQVKSRLTCENNVCSMNYSIQTVKHVVYIMGIAQNEDELKKVTEIAGSTPGVKKVVCFVKTKDDIKKT